MFVDSCKRIRLMKSSEASNLCKNPNPAIHVPDTKMPQTWLIITQVLTFLLCSMQLQGHHPNDCCHRPNAYAQGGWSVWICSQQKRAVEEAWLLRSSMHPIHLRIRDVQSVVVLCTGHTQPWGTCLSSRCPSSRPDGLVFGRRREGRRHSFVS